MTAVVGILNKKGVAVAADSAVTVATPNNRKIYNSANKIFTLSKYHPVGVALYNGADFMGIPWEIIIKEYRSYIGSRCFNTVQDYRDDFLRWMRDDCSLFKDERSEDYLMNDLLILFHQVWNRIHQMNEIPNKQNFLKSFENIKTELEEYAIVLPDVDAIKRELTLFRESGIIAAYTEKALGIALTDEELNLIEDVYATYLSRDYFLNYTGLIFVGYGDKELFPRVLPINVSIAIGDELRFVYDENNEVIISNDFSASVSPFAQKDVIQTILQGISPDLLSETQSIFDDFFRKIIDFTLDLGVLSDKMKTKLNSMGVAEIRRLSEPFRTSLQNKIQRNHVFPMLDTVSHLDKEDLAEMAESLIYLTYLKRRFTMSEESVGGPVDVAIITKGDGFIWVKRKHYFEPDLNKHFFQKYYK